MTCLTFPPPSVQALAAVCAAGRAGAAFATAAVPATAAAPATAMLSVRTPPVRAASGFLANDLGDSDTRTWGYLHRVRTRARRGSGVATVSEAKSDAGGPNSNIFRKRDERRPDARRTPPPQS